MDEAVHAITGSEPAGGLITRFDDLTGCLAYRTLCQSWYTATRNI